MLQVSEPGFNAIYKLETRTKNTTCMEYDLRSGLRVRLLIMSPRVLTRI